MIYFIAFVEEVWGKRIVGLRQGRIDVYKKDDDDNFEEIPYKTTMIQEFLDFREQYNFKYVTEEDYNEMKRICEEQFQDTE
jgi:hypothetical protein